MARWKRAKSIMPRCITASAVPGSRAKPRWPKTSESLPSILKRAAIVCCASWNAHRRGTAILLITLDTPLFLLLKLNMNSSSLLAEEEEIDYGYCCSARCFSGDCAASRNHSLHRPGNRTNACFDSWSVRQHDPLEPADSTAGPAVPLHCAGTATGRARAPHEARRRPQPAGHGAAYRRFHASARDRKSVVQGKRVGLGGRR